MKYVKTQSSYSFNIQFRDVGEITGKEGTNYSYPANFVQTEPGAVVAPSNQPASTTKPSLLSKVQGLYEYEKSKVVGKVDKLLHITPESVINSESGYKDGNYNISIDKEYILQCNISIIENQGVNMCNENEKLFVANLEIINPYSQTFYRENPSEAALGSSYSTQYSNLFLWANYTQNADQTTNDKMSYDATFADRKMIIGVWGSDVNKYYLQYKIPVVTLVSFNEGESSTVIELIAPFSPNIQESNF